MHKWPLKEEKLISAYSLKLPGLLKTLFFSIIYEWKRRLANSTFLYMIPTLKIIILNMLHFGLQWKRNLKNFHLTINLPSGWYLDVLLSSPIKISISSLLVY